MIEDLIIAAVSSYSAADNARITRHRCAERKHKLIDVSMSVEHFHHAISVAIADVQNFRR